MDAADFEGVGELFAHGAVMDAQGRELARGRGAVAEFFRAIVMLHEGSPRTLHTTVNPVVDVDEVAGGATARSVYVVYQAVDGPPEPIVTGRYRDRFQRVDGVWRFAERRFFVEQMGDVSQHLHSPHRRD